MRLDEAVTEARIGVEESVRGDAHVMPMSKKHRMSSRCWCHPEIDYVAEDGTKVWLHHVGLH